MIYKVETEREFPAFSDGGLYSTVGDMLKYDRALYENKLLSQKTNSEKALKLLDRYLRIGKGRSNRTKSERFKESLKKLKSKKRI